MVSLKLFISDPQPWIFVHHVSHMPFDCSPSLLYYSRIFIIIVTHCLRCSICRAKDNQQENNEEEDDEGAEGPSSTQALECIGEQ